MRVPFAFALLLLAAPLGAQTYKWVDERGVVNYSNAPPPTAAGAKATPIGERVSTLPTDPVLVQEIAAYRARRARQADYDEQDWARRQQLLAAYYAATPYEDCAYGGCGTMAYPYRAAYSSYYPYYGPVFTAIVPRRAASFRSFSPGFRHTSSGTHVARTGHSGRSWR